MMESTAEYIMIVLSFRFSLIQSNLPLMKK